MLFVVTVLTQQLQVVKAERDARIVNVSCSQMHFVVNDFAGLTAALTNAVLKFEICKPAILPALGFVKLDSKRFHGKKKKVIVFLNYHFKLILLTNGLHFYSIPNSQSALT